MKVIVEADGGSRDNPGPAGYGALVRDTDSGEVLVERAEGIGVATNNVAEYQGLPAGLDAVAQLGSDEVSVRMESKLVVEPEHVRIGSRSRPRCWWSSPPERGRYGSAAARWHEHHRPGSDYRLHNAAVAISDFPAASFAPCVLFITRDPRQGERESPHAGTIDRNVEIERPLAWKDGRHLGLALALLEVHLASEKTARLTRRA